MIRSEAGSMHYNSMVTALDAILALSFAYGAASLAIDSGNLIWYAATFILLILFVRLFVTLIWKAVHRG